MRIRFAAILCALLLGGQATAQSPDPDPGALRRGEFIWHPEISPSGPVVIVVSLDEQRVYVYRNGMAIGASSISSGRKGHDTPPGVFTILQKDVEHYSNKYDDAPMPYMERLTWDGVAMHGGTLPGYPASHGCIRLPLAFARKLFDVTTRGVTVIVANSKTSPAGLVHPALLAPTAAASEDLESPAPVPGFSWDDLPATAGPVSVLVSTRDRIVLVFRNGKLIGSSRISDPGVRIGGSVLYVMGEGTDYVPSTLDPARPKHLWAAYPLATRSNPNPRTDVASAFHVAPEFAQRVYDVLTPGTTVLVTDLPAVRRSIDNRPMRVLESTAARP